MLQFVCIFLSALNLTSLILNFLNVLSGKESLNPWRVHSLLLAAGSLIYDAPFDKLR